MDFVGKTVKAKFWNEPVRIEKVEKIHNDYYHIIGILLDSRKSIDTIIDEKDYKSIAIIDENIDFSANAEEIFFFLEATRFNYASLFDLILAVNVSKVDPLPFQIEAVYGYILKQPHIRFLIADDPGAGKTIMSGLIIKELKLRKLSDRILIVVPGHLKDQWRRELKEKFNEVFFVMDRSTFNANYGENPWEKNNQIITSLDFIKQEDILASLSSSDWDLTIVDEAHKMAAYRYGDKTHKTQRYKVGEVLSKISNHLLFLTATPHKGDPENFRLFLDLLVPGFFASNEMVERSLKNKDNPLFIRRLKEDLTDFEGKPIFTRRYTQTMKFSLSDTEKELYNELSRYVVEQYNMAMQFNNKKRNIAFALLILQRRMASSMYALTKSLERRKERLSKILKEGDEIKQFSLTVYDIDEIDDIEEIERWEKEKEWETLTLAQDPTELQNEINTIDSLIKKARHVINKELEVKVTHLKKSIELGFQKIEEMGGHPKILIFTESKDTLFYLEEKIKHWGYRVNTIYGGMSMEDRIMAEKVFRDETDILLATEAAGEGINLQFCHIMINYDIPWNPNRLEQRMGRIHRYGQQKDVYIFNLVANDTAEGKVLNKIFDKLEEIKNKLGNDRVFDVIGEIFDGRNLHQLILDAIVNAKSMDEILSELDIEPDENYISKIKDVLGESLATKYIDYTRIKELSEKAREYRLVPEYVEEFFKRVFIKSGGRLRELKTGFLAIDSIPYEIKAIAKNNKFKNKYGIMKGKYPKVTFDKEIAFKNPDAEFISFGHPLLESLLEWVFRNFQENVKKGSVFTDPSGNLDGYIWFFVAEIRDGKGEVAGKRIISAFESKDKIIPIAPSVLWDLIPIKESNFDNIAPDKDKILPFIIDKMENYKNEILHERERQANIKKKYGLQSLDYLISKLDTEIAELYEREGKGEKVDLPIRNKEERKKKYEETMNIIKKEIEQEQSLTMSMPQLLTVIKVVSKKNDMVENKEIENIGMAIAFEYEKQHGRIPEDVSMENLGFDIRSKGEDEIRYIEVKARANEGEVALTPNEWFKAKRFKDKYWLYIVSNAATNPVLNIINNPAKNLNPQEKVEIVRFIVASKEWKEKKIEAWSNG